MQSLPSADELRAQLAPMDQRHKKIVAGLLSVMIQNPERVREREWISEQLTQVTLLAGESCGTTEAHEGLEQVQSFLSENINTLLNASFALFAQVAADMSGRGEFDADEALIQGMSYF